MLFCQRESENSEQRKKRLRSNLSDLYLSGTISGLRAATLFTDASVAGAATTADLADRESRNSQRDLRRNLLKNSKWPPLYRFEAPVMHQKTHASTFEEIAALLPHEVVAVILTWNKDCPRLFEISGMAPE